MLFRRSLLRCLLVAAAARRATLLAVVAHLHRGNVNDCRVLPAFRTRSPRESSLKAGLRIGHVHSPFCAGFSNRSRNRWTSDSVRPTSPFFILTAQSVPSRTKRRSVGRGMPRRLAAWLQARILSAGSVGSSGANQLPFGAGLFQPALVVHGDRILNRWIPLCWALWYGNASRPFSCCGMVLLLAELRRFVPSSCSRIAVKPWPNVGPAPDQGPASLGDGAIGRSWRSGNRSAVCLNW